MINMYTKILDDPDKYRQFNLGESLVARFECPLETKFNDIWSKHNYIVYVTEGRKIWHTPKGAYDLQKGNCAFIRKGANIMEQFFDHRFCMILFYVPDEFIVETLKNKSFGKTNDDFQPIFPISTNTILESFFNSMISYFNSNKVPDSFLLELKFRELIFTIADEDRNHEILSYFGSLISEPRSVSLNRIMEENLSFNLSLEDFAALCNRSLSAFKRDFKKLYNTSPGKWLLEKRLSLAMHILKNSDKTVTETAFESGFENPAHFSRSFKDQFGISPSMIRQSKSA